MNSIQLTIAEPCHEDWANMQPEEQGRFCGSCKKSVIDFSVMNNKEIYSTILKGTAEVCGRFSPQQLAQPIHDEVDKKHRWHKYFFSFLVPAFLFSKQSLAQKTVGKVKATKPVCNVATMGMVAKVPVQKHFEFRGVVTDATSNEAVSNATVQIKDGNEGVISDSAGNFKLAGTTSHQTVTIVISAIGFATREVKISVPADEFIMAGEKIQLEKMATMMKDVFMKSTIKGMLCGIAGGITIRTKDSKATLLKARIAAAITDSLTIYPNPVERGGSFTATIKVKKAGRYVLQIVDVAGVVMYQQQINAVDKIQQQTIESSAKWSSGIYFLRVVGNDNKLVSNSRVVVR